MYQKIYKFVNDKVGIKIDAEIEGSIQNRKKIDVQNYVNKLIDDEFNEYELNRLEAKLRSAQENASEIFKIDGEDDLLEADCVVDINLLTLKSDLSRDIDGTTKKLIQSLEYLSAEEIIHQSSWPETRKSLIALILSEKNINAITLILTIFKRLLDCTNSPKTVCEAFVALTDAVALQIDEINKRANMVESEELYLIEENKVLRQSSERRNIEPAVEEIRLEGVTKAMLLLVSTQHSMPSTWSRFNERRLSEIIFAFVHMLTVSATEKRTLSALDLLSIVEPRASWCRHWCHSALGRTLLCQSLRQNRRLLNVIVDTTANSTAGVEDGRSTVLPVLGSALHTARVCQCVTILASIVQCRAGRALFPLQTNSRRRPWTAQDVVGLIMNYASKKEEGRSLSYQLHLTEIARSLSEVEEGILTARGTKHVRRGHR